MTNTGTNRWQAGATRVGGLRAFVAGADFLKDPIRGVERAYRRFGPTVMFTSKGKSGLSIRSVMLIGPAYNREILSNTERLRPSGLWSVRGPRGSVQRAMKFTYVTSTGAEHAELLKTTSPHLSRQRVAGHFDAIKKLVGDGIRSWPRDQRVDLYSLSRDLGQLVAFKLLFGETNEATIRSFGGLLANYHNANWQLGAHVKLNLPGSPYKRVLQQAVGLRDFVARWVEAGRGCPAGHDLRSAFDAHRTVDGNPLSPEAIAAHVSFFGFAAYETMSSVLTWSLLLLATHPDVHADLADELADGTSIDDIDQDELDALPLLEGVIKEALRLIPPTPVLVWRTIQRWETEGLRLRRGTRIVLSPHLTHRMPECYAEPQRFNPARWLTIKPTMYEYLPFGAGPRRCPGYAFAMEFLKVALATFVPALRVDLRPGTRVDRVYRGITMPKPGIQVRLLGQDRSFKPVRVTGNIRDLVDLPRSAQRAV